MSHPLECKCGKIKGIVADPGSANHAICYCKDCQAFAHFLGSAAEILDKQGGSDIVQVLPKNLTFTQGVESLACMRLTPKGLLRWYASCCRTPIGNTLATPKISFVGLLHSCLEGRNGSMTDVFGPVVACVNINGAIGSPKPKAKGQGRTLGWFIRTALGARINGDYKRTPFFRPDTGVPVVTPKVLTDEERAVVMDAVRTAWPL
jgi:Family of unknown function (DUF6151)